MNQIGNFLFENELITYSLVVNWVIFSANELIANVVTKSAGDSGFPRTDDNISVVLTNPGTPGGFIAIKNLNQASFPGSVVVHFIRIPEVKINLYQ